MTIAAMLAVLCTAGLLSGIVGGPGNAPQPNSGNMITAAAVERAGATLLPTSAE